MNKTPKPSFCGVHAFLRLCRFLFSAIFLFFFQTATAQCSLSCQNIQASLNNNCEVTITVPMLLAGGPPPGCTGPLSVVVYNAAGTVPIPTSPVITGAYIGQTLKGRVVDAASGNLCWSNILVEDKLKPDITCHDTLISVFHSTAPATAGFPIAVDNCDDTLALTFTSAAANFDCTLTDTVTIINRLWTATDDSGNLSSCIQKIYVFRPDLDELNYPPDHNGIQAPPLYCPSANTTPASTGRPSYNGVAVNGLHSYSAQYDDVSVPNCEGSNSLFREWEVFDGCAGESLIDDQFIEVFDTLPPVLTCPVNILATTSNLDCTATVIVPTPVTFDSCSTQVDLSLSGVPGILNGLTIYNLPRGEYNTTCSAADDCGNVTSCIFQITVRDNTPPVASSNPSVNISLLPVQPTQIPAATFNNGSWDNCTTVTFAARRLDSPDCPGDDSTPFAPTVPFNCCDAGKTIQIILRVTDVDGNTATVMSSAQVFDNLNPGLVCPADITLDCGQDFNNLSLTGNPIVTDNCPGFAVTHTDATNLNACGVGSITRTWKVEDASGRTATCIQHITLSNLDPFYINPANAADPNDDVIWPPNYIAYSCGAGLSPQNLPPPYNAPQILSDTSNCQTIVVSYTDNIFSAPSGACLEILRDWLIIDWCQFNPLTFAGSWHYGQVIRITDSDDPVVTACTNTSFCSFDADCETGQVNFTVTATDDCTPAPQLTFEWKVDEFNDGAVNQTGAGATVNGQFPIGTHQVTFTVEDGCHNESSCSWLFTVRDCKPPTPLCDAFIVVISDSNFPEVEVSAINFDAGSSDNCSEPVALIFSFSKDSLEAERTFDCAGVGTNALKIWVKDEEGNQDFCVIDLIIQQTSGACSSDAFIAGHIENEEGENIALVAITLNDPALLGSMVTDTSGSYTFDNLLPGGDYTVTPAKDILPMNGVTTFDLVLITRHILGAQPLGSPYKIIAADVNRSGSVSTLDLVALRRLILAIELEFPNNNSWRFVDAAYQFQNPQNPLAEPFPELLSVNNLSGEEMLNFIAIKVGDVNGSANGSQ